MAINEVEFTEAVQGHLVKGVPVNRRSGTELVVYVYESANQGPIYGRPTSMSDDEAATLEVPDAVQDAVNDMIERGSDLDFGGGPLL